MKNILIIFFLGIGLLSANDPLATEKALLLEAEQLAAKPDAASRIQATQYIIAADSPLVSTKLVSKLIDDADPKVRLNMLRAMPFVVNKRTFTKEEAWNFSEPLRKSLNRSSLEQLNGCKISETETMLLISQAVALNSLYQWYPLVSVIDYENWQQQDYSLIIRRLSGCRKQFSKELDEQFNILLLYVCDPRALVDMLEMVISDLSKLPADRIENTLIALWRNPLCGKLGPMRLSLKFALQSKMDSLNKGIPGNSIDREEINDIIKMISEK
jgi:hypothetical protein